MCCILFSASNEIYSSLSRTPVQYVNQNSSLLFACTDYFNALKSDK